MTNQTRTVLLLLAVLGVASAAQAGGPDALRCEARKLRCESDYFQCVSRCDRRATREAARLDGARPAAADTACEDKCSTRHGETMQRIALVPPCADQSAPDPATCEARLLRLAANHRICQSRCTHRERPNDDGSDCLARCQTRCGTSVDETLAQLICAEGRMSGDQVCGGE